MRGSFCIKKNKNLRAKNKYIHTKYIYTYVHTYIREKGCVTNGFYGFGRRVFFRRVYSVLTLVVSLLVPCFDASCLVACTLFGRFLSRCVYLVRTKTKDLSRALLSITSESGAELWARFRPSKSRGRQESSG